MDAADTEPSPWLLFQSVDDQKALNQRLVRCLSCVTTKKSSQDVWNNKPAWWDTEFLEALEQVEPEVKGTSSWEYYKRNRELTWKNPTAETEDSILKVRIGLLLKHLKTEEPDDETERRQIKILTHVWENGDLEQLKKCCTFLGALAHTEIATKLHSNTDPEIARQAEQFLEESRRCFEDRFGALVNQGQTSSQPLDSALTLRKHVALDQARHTPPSEYKDRDIRRSQRSDANCKNSNIPVTTDARESPTHCPSQPEQPESDHSQSHSVGQIVDKGKQLGAPSATTPGEPEAEPYGSSEVPSADPCLKRMGDTQTEKTNKRRKVDNDYLESVCPSFTGSGETTLTTPIQVHETVVNPDSVPISEGPPFNVQNIEYHSAHYNQNNYLDVAGQSQWSYSGNSYDDEAMETSLDLMDDLAKKRSHHAEVFQNQLNSTSACDKSEKGESHGGLGVIGQNMFAHEKGAEMESLMALESGGKTYSDSDIDQNWRIREQYLDSLDGAAPESENNEPLIPAAAPVGPAPATAPVSEAANPVPAIVPALANQGQTSSQPLRDAVILRGHVELNQAQRTSPSEYKDEDIRRSQRSDENYKNSNKPVTTDAGESPTCNPRQPEQPESDHSVSDSPSQREPYGSSEPVLQRPSADQGLKQGWDTRGEKTDKRRKSVTSALGSDVDRESADTGKPLVNFLSARSLGPNTSEKGWLDFAVRELSRHAVIEAHKASVWQHEPPWWKGECGCGLPWKNPTTNPKDSKDALETKFECLVQHLRKEKNLPGNLREEIELWESGKKEDAISITNKKVLLAKAVEMYGHIEKMCEQEKKAATPIRYKATDNDLLNTLERIVEKLKARNVSSHPLCKPATSTAHSHSSAQPVQREGETSQTGLSSGSHNPQNEQEQEQTVSNTDSMLAIGCDDSDLQSVLEKFFESETGPFLDSLVDGIDSDTEN